jgi:hypothetical protein
MYRAGTIMTCLTCQSQDVVPYVAVDTPVGVRGTHLVEETQCRFRCQACGGERVRLTLRSAAAPRAR